jgi:hypothetical protein
MKLEAKSDLSGFSARHNIFRRQLAGKESFFRQKHPRERNSLLSLWCEQKKLTKIKVTSRIDTIIGIPRPESHYGVLRFAHSNNEVTPSSRRAEGRQGIHVWRSPLP